MNSRHKNRPKSSYNITKQAKDPSDRPANTLSTDPQPLIGTCLLGDDDVSFTINDKKETGNGSFRKKYKYQTKSRNYHYQPFKQYDSDVGEKSWDTETTSPQSSTNSSPLLTPLTPQTLSFSNTSDIPTDNLTESSQNSIGKVQVDPLLSGLLQISDSLQDGASDSLLKGASDSLQEGPDEKLQFNLLLQEAFSSKATTLISPRFPPGIPIAEHLLPKIETHLESICYGQDNCSDSTCENHNNDNIASNIDVIIPDDEFDLDSEYGYEPSAEYQYPHQYQNQYKYCHNCGKSGHNSKKCRAPVLSYGIILYYKYNIDEFMQGDIFCPSVITQNRAYDSYYRDISNLLLTEDPDEPDYEIINNIKEIHPASPDQIKYLMILDRHTPDYVQIILGNYDFEDVNYIRTLISRLTHTEIRLINCHTLTYLFVKYWTFSNRDALKLYRKQYNHSKRAFKALKNGIKNSNGEYIKFQKIVQEINPQWTESDWGFPKGRRRRSCHELDIECAKREFQEETGIHPSYYNVLPIPPFEETFQGSNGITYRHLYYLAEAKEYIPIYLDPNNVHQTTEIRKIGWYTYESGVNMIRGYHKERKSLFNQVHTYLNKTL